MVNKKIILLVSLASITIYMCTMTEKNWKKSFWRYQENTANKPLDGSWCCLITKGNDWGIQLTSKEQDLQSIFVFTVYGICVVFPVLAIADLMIELVPRTLNFLMFYMYTDKHLINYKITIFLILVWSNFFRKDCSAQSISCSVLFKFLSHFSVRYYYLIPL